MPAWMCNKSNNCLRWQHQTFVCQRLDFWICFWFLWFTVECSSNIYASCSRRRSWTTNQTPISWIVQIAPCCIDVSSMQWYHNGMFKSKWIGNFAKYFWWSTNQSGRSSKTVKRSHAISISENVVSFEFMMGMIQIIKYFLFWNSYIKKVIEDVHVGEEGLKLLQYCCWENPIFSRNVLVELLWQCGFTYWHDLRHHTDMLLNILLMDDSWQNHRIHNALLGVAEEREGLLEIIQRTKTHYQKRAYQIMKCLVQLFKSCQCAHEMLLNNFKVTTQWVMACEWLREELERRVPSNQYSYSSWSHSTVVSSAATNDNSNGYMLERSQSAKNLLALAFELCPTEVSYHSNRYFFIWNQLCNKIIFCVQISWILLKMRKHQMVFWFGYNHNRC